MNINSMPPHKMLPYTGSGRTVEEMLIAADGPRGAQNYQLRMVMENIIRWVEPRDLRSQITAIRDWFMAYSAYVHDPIPTELVRDPLRTLHDIKQYGRFLGDCDDAATFLVGGYRSLGIKSLPARVGFTNPRVSRGRVRQAPYTHVLAIAVDQFRKVLVVDPVAHTKTFQMLRRVKRVG